MNLTRRAILASAGIAGAFLAVPAIAKAPLSERIEKFLANMAYSGNNAVRANTIDPEVLEALRPGDILVESRAHDAIYLTRRGIEMGQVFLAARSGLQARFLMAQAFDNKPAKPGYAYKVLRGSEVENANHRRVFAKAPEVNGALPRTVMTQEQAARGDWRMVMLREAYLRPVAAGTTLLALERTPAGEEWYEACLLDRQVDRVEARLKALGINPVFDMDKAHAFQASLA